MTIIRTVIIICLVGAVIAAAEGKVKSLRTRVYVWVLAIILLATLGVTL